MVVVLANYYAASLPSFMSVNKLQPIINSLDGLANSKETKLIGQAGSDLANRFLVGIYFYYP